MTLTVYSDLYILEKAYIGGNTPLSGPLCGLGGFLFICRGASLPLIRIEATFIHYCIYVPLSQGMGGCSFWQFPDCEMSSSVSSASLGSGNLHDHTTTSSSYLHLLWMHTQEHCTCLASYRHVDYTECCIAVVSSIAQHTNWMVHKVYTLMKHLIETKELRIHSCIFLALLSHYLCRAIAIETWIQTVFFCISNPLLLGACPYVTHKN